MAQVAVSNSNPDLDKVPDEKSRASQQSPSSPNSQSLPPTKVEQARIPKKPKQKKLGQDDPLVDKYKQQLANTTPEEALAFLNQAVTEIIQQGLSQYMAKNPELSSADLENMTAEQKEKVCRMMGTEQLTVAARAIFRLAAQSADPNKKQELEKLGLRVCSAALDTLDVRRQSWFSPPDERDRLGMWMEYAVGAAAQHEPASCLADAASVARKLSRELKETSQANQALDSDLRQLAAEVMKQDQPRKQKRPSPVKVPKLEP